MNPIHQSQITRRQFTAGAAGAASVLLVKPQSAFGASANSKIELGVVGSGGRGHFITQKFAQLAEDEVQVVAIQDPFADRLQTLKERFALDDARVYEGVYAYRDMMASDLDAVIITSPPYFHPEQVELAVDHGKHVWLSKPVASDVTGCLRVLESSRKAKANGLNFLVDFQARNSPNFKECVRRVHEGAIGDIVLGQVYYIAGRLGVQAAPGASEDEFRLRNWVFDIKLSGDIIVEQNVHVLDMGNWLIDDHPIRAFGTCGRKARVDVGDCMDHFIVTYWYPNDIKVDFSSAQFTRGYDDLCARMFGSQGTADTHYAGANWGQGPVRITGDNPWPGVDRDHTWEAVDNNVRDFVQALQGGESINHGEYSVNSTLTGVLGRMAAYAEEVVTWDEMLASGEQFEVDLSL